MDDVVLVEVVDGLEDLANGLRGILLGELALFANSVEQLAAGGQLGDDVVLVLYGRGVSVDGRPKARQDGVPWTRTSRQT